ncbi:MAG: hypothetical protein AAGB16_07525, partial [Pseudomonadota bacterium]
MNVVIQEELSEQLVQQISRRPDRYLEQKLGGLYQIDAQGRVTREALEDYLEVESSKQRATLISRYLYIDVTADAVLQQAELNQAKAFMTANQKAALDVMVSAADQDSDGDISYSELLTHAQQQIEAQTRNRSGYAHSDLMLHDLDLDGAVTPEELRASVTKITDEAPSPEEYQRQLRQARMPARTPQPVCELPVPSKTAEIVLLSGYEGAALSTVTVGGQDQETSVATLNIEPGKPPLYIIASALDHIIWKLDGATERVEMFVAQPGRTNKGPGAGVVGLAAQKVDFIPANACFNYFTSPEDGKARLAMTRIEAALGRPVSHLVSAYDLQDMPIPSGRSGKPPETRRGPTIITQDGSEFVIQDGKYVKQTAKGTNRLQSEFKRFYPAGIISIDPKTVISAGKVETYEVLPQQAGLLQLVQAGKIQITPDGYYRITKNIARFPAGLNGAHSVRFLIADVVSVPEVSPGHSTVILEATGECVS